MIIELDGLRIEVIKKHIKNMNVRIYPPDGLVKISAPWHYQEQVIRTFLQKHSMWIHSQRNRIKENAIKKDAPLQTGGTVLFQGMNFPFIVEEHNGPAHIECREGAIYCHAPYHSTPEQINTLLDRWYKKEMTTVLPPLIQHWQTIIGVHVIQWGIRKMTTRWGSCNTKARRISLNLNLIKKPRICLEYVLVHELVHLLEASHNQRFYRLMDQFMPQWREYSFLLDGKRPRK